MNVFARVTIQSLKRNRTRTLVTIIGVILSAAMICAVTTFVSSIQNYIVEFTKYTNGDWHGAVFGCDKDEYDSIAQNEKVSDVASGQILGYAAIDSSDISKPYLYVLGGDAAFFEMLPVHLVSGRLPENSSEIIIPAHLSALGGISYQNGDVISLPLGTRTMDGLELGQTNIATHYDSASNKDVPNDETLVINETRSYTVVGIYLHSYILEEFTAPGFAALTVADTAPADDACFDVYFKLHKASQIYDFLAGIDLDSKYNTDLLLYSGISRHNTFSQMILSLAVIVIALIMLGSISLIYTAFSISVSERTKQFGLLSSVGATKRQLGKMVIFESLFISAVGIPLGIASGIGGIAVTLLFVGKKFIAMIGNDFSEPLRVCVSWQSVVIAALIALITVLISAYIPSRRATRISAIEAIRQNADIRSDPKNAKSSKLGVKLFGLPGLLASRHYKRNRKKYRTTVLSLFMSIVLFVSSYAFSDGLMRAVEDGLSGDKYDLWLETTDDELNGMSYDELLDILSEDADLTGSAFVRRCFYRGGISGSQLSSRFISDSTQLAAQNENGDYFLSGYIYFVNDSGFEALLDEYGLDRDAYFNPASPLALALDNNTYFDAVKEKYVTVDALRGDGCDIVCSTYYVPDGYMLSDYNEDAGIYTYVNRNDESDSIVLGSDEACLEIVLHSEKTIEEAPFYIGQNIPMHLAMIYPESMLQYVIPENAIMYDNLNYVDYYFVSDNHASSYADLKDRLFEHGLDPTALVDYAENADSSRNIVSIIRVFSYGFIILISLIAAANVFNTISTNISLRRRELAMLSSIGMTPSDFNKMMNYECLLYGSKSLLLGLPVSAVMSYLIHLAFTNGYEASFVVPWPAFAISVLCVFAVVFVSMLYSMSKIKKASPIETLKNENL